MGRQSLGTLQRRNSVNTAPHEGRQKTAHENALRLLNVTSANKVFYIDWFLIWVNFMAAYCFSLNYNNLSYSYY